MKTPPHTCAALTRLMLALSVAAAFLAASSSALAQQSATSQDPRVAEDERLADDSVVELPAFRVGETSETGYLSKNTLAGTRTTELLIDIPQEIAIANKELISDLGVIDMLPAVQFVTGGVSRRGLNVGDDVYIRGFRAFTSLKDGFLFGSNAVGTLYDVDRVEVIKGPAALIFGQASFTGGIINYVTRRPTERTSVEVKAVVGSFDFYRGEAHFSGPVHGRKDLRYRVDVGLTDSDYGPRRFSYYKDKFIGVGMDYDFSDTTKLTVDASIADVEYNYSNTLHDPVTRQVIAMPSDFTIDEAWARYPTHQERVTATLTSTIAEGFDIRLFVGYNNSGNDWLRPFALGFQADNNTLNRLAENFVTSAHFFTTQIDTLKKFQTGPVQHKLSFGGEQRDTTGATRNQSFALDPLDVRNPVWGAQPSTTPGTGLVQYNDRTFGRSREQSAYIQDQASLLNDRLILIAGARYNAFSSHGGAQGTAGTNRHDSETVKRFGVLFHPTAHTSVYYNNSESFLFNGGLDFLGRQLVPSIGKINEFGAKAELFNGALILTGSYFDIKLTNVRVVFVQGPGDPLPGAFGARQTGLEKNKGFEFTAAASRDVKMGHLDFIATWYAGDVKDALGLKPINPPNNTYSAFGVFRLTQGPLAGFGFGGGVFFEGERVGPSLDGLPLKFDSFTTVNGLITYNFNDRLKLQVNVDNIADDEYVIGGESALWTVTSIGRNIKLSASYKF